MEYRINGFDQIKSFYSIVFSQKYDIKPQHVSLYNFLINQNNRNNWVEWFKCPYDLAMTGACIGSKKTYYKCLKDLQDWNLIQYKKGTNEWKAPKIKLEVLKCTSSVPQGEPLDTPLGTPLGIPQGTPLGTQRYKQVTSNLKLITDNIDNILIFLKNRIDGLIGKLNQEQLNQEQINKLKEIIKKHEPQKPKFSFKNELLNLGADEQHINDWMQVRKTKKATNTKTALDAIIKEAKENNFSIAKAVQICAEKNWVGFKAQWVKNSEADELQKENQILKVKEENRKLKNKEYHEEIAKQRDVLFGFTDPFENQEEPETQETDYTEL